MALTPGGSRLPHNIWSEPKRELEPVAPYGRGASMNQDFLSERFFEALIGGDREASRQVARDAEPEFGGPEGVLSELIWPTYEKLDKLHRADQLSRLAFQFATRLLRAMVDQYAARLPAALRNQVTVSIFCGESVGEELGAQMAVDVLESAGFTVRFGGGGIAADEVLAHVHETRPDILLMFCAAASDLPGIRSLLDTLREINACPTTRLVVGGGVFNRAPGLAEEMGAEVCVGSPIELADAIVRARRGGVAQQIERKPAALEKRRAA